MQFSTILHPRTGEIPNPRKLTNQNSSRILPLDIIGSYIIQNYSELCLRIRIHQLHRTCYSDWKLINAVVFCQPSAWATSIHHNIEAMELSDCNFCWWCGYLMWVVHRLRPQKRYKKWTKVKVSLGTETWRSAIWQIQARGKLIASPQTFLACRLWEKLLQYMASHLAARKIDLDSQGPTWGCLQTPHQHRQQSCKGPKDRHPSKFPIV